MQSWQNGKQEHPHDHDNRYHHPQSLKRSTSHMPFEDYLSKHLQPGETVVTIVRRIAWTMVPGLLGTGSLIIVNFFLLAWWFQWRGWGGLGFSLVLLLAGWWAVRTIYVWRLNLLVITSQRIIDVDQRGFFQRAVAEAPYQKIQDVRYTVRGLWQTMFHFGSVIIQTAGSATNLELTGIADPVGLQRLIADIQQRAGPARDDDLSAPELLEVLNRLKAEIGEDRLRSIIQRRPPTKV